MAGDDERSDLARRIGALLRGREPGALEGALAGLAPEARGGPAESALRGEIERRAGRAAEAARLLAVAAVGWPRSNAIAHALALARIQSGDRDGARAAWRAIVERHPADPAARYQIAVSYDEENRIDEAIGWYQAQVEAHPAAVAAWLNLGRLRLRTADPAAAIGAYRRATELDPAHAGAWTGIATACERAGDAEAAIDAWDRARAADPANATPLERRARLLAARSALPEAIAALDAAIRLEPRRASLHWACAAHLQQLGEHADALARLRAARTIDPRNAAGHSALLVELQHDAALATRDELAAEHRHWASEHASPIAAAPARPRPRRDRLRVGYLSPRFAAGPLATLFLPLLEHLDRSRHEIVLYSAHRHDDAIARRFRALADHYRELPDDDDTAATVIAGDQLDLLIDLAGHTPGHRLLALARRPARVQATWMDYVDTTGLAAIDYALTDAVHVPDHDASRFVERIVRLPTRLAYRPPIPALATPSPRDRRGYPTFGSFNRHAKLNDATLAAWSAILVARPEARLELRAAAYNDPGTVAWIAKRWSARGVPVDRVDFRPWAPLADAFAAYAGIDVALDPFPYNGGVTTCDALANGVPLVALAGDRPLARQSASLLAAAGRPDWVAANVDDYVALALELAAAPAADADRTRASLSAGFGASRLADVEGFARTFERACATMVEVGPRGTSRGPLPPLEIDG
ncbi:MAG: tetratricopeptide repeat protein [Burkholderiales bacterium]